jgi:hypothetical protein
MWYLLVASVTSLKVRTTGYLGGLVKSILTILIFQKSYLGQPVNVNTYNPTTMSTTADSTTYGSISNAPGKRDENQQTNKVHTTTNVSDAGAGAVTTTTTVAASYGAAATTVALNATVDAAETAIRTVRRARTNPSTLATGKVTGLATRKETGAVASFGTRVNGSGYTNGTYTNIALSGGTGTGATANLTVSGGAVTASALVRGGQFYLVGDVLSCALIGAGTAFALPVATITQG